MRTFLLFLLAVIFTACSNSKNDTQRILGHWESDRIQIQSIYLPVGPKFSVYLNELVSFDHAIKIPISEIISKGNEVTLNMATGFGLSFYFESNDHIYVDAPLIGKIYFHKVNENGVGILKNNDPLPVTSSPQQVFEESKITPAAATGIIKTLPEVPAASRIEDSSLEALINAATLDYVQGRRQSAEDLISKAKIKFKEEPRLDFLLARLRLIQGDQDLTIRHLARAFKNGFRTFSLLDDTADFDAIKSDSRYQALLARYR